MSAAETIELVRALKSNCCACGRYKRSGASFCFECYWSLGIRLRGELYQRVGEGYEEAYASAIEKLKKKGRVA